MASPIFLIAEREFRTYVATWSFWLSLAVAPLAAAVALFFLGGSPAMMHVRIDTGGDTLLSQGATRAIGEAARLENRSIIVTRDGARASFSRADARTIVVRFDPNFPLSPVGRALAMRLLERDASQTAGAALLQVSDRSVPLPTHLDREALVRLITMAMLWLTLTGSLGMLLQAVVRERANRALESLLAAARGRQIVLGKILGVGAVSMLVLLVWFGFAAALSVFAAKGPTAAIATLSNPLYLLRVGVIYLCAFAFYGSITVALGALARDSAAAQNLARPMFVVLLIGFLAALSSFNSSTGPGNWLVFLPFFTPFLLLALPSVAVPLQCVLLLALLALSFATATLAAAFLNNTAEPQSLVRLFSTLTKPRSRLSPP